MFCDILKETMCYFLMTGNTPTVDRHNPHLRVMAVNGGFYKIIKK